MPPECLEKVEFPEVRKIVEQCIHFKKEERPTTKQLLELDFFCDERWFKLDLLNYDSLVLNDESMIKFRYQITSPEKLKKSTLKENEAIEFDFNLQSDECAEIIQNMQSKGKYQNPLGF